MNAHTQKHTRKLTECNELHVQDIAPRRGKITCLLFWGLAAFGLLLIYHAATAADRQLTHSQTLAEYQSTEQVLTNQGFRPVSLDVDGTGADSRFAVVWLKDGVTDWFSEIELTATQFKDRIANLAVEGYRVLCLDSHGAYPNELYAAVWVKPIKGLESVTDVRNLTGSLMQSRADSGYAPTWFDLNVVGNNHWFGVTYSKGGGNWAIYYGLTEADFRQKLQDWSLWMWPAVVRINNGLYSAVWADRNRLDSDDFKVELNQTAAELAHTITQHTENGYEPVSLTQSSTTGQALFCSVWRRRLVSLEPNRISGIVRPDDGATQLRIQNAVPDDLKGYFEVLPLQSSTNLVDWEPLVTVIKTNANPSPVVWTDSEATQLPQRFYRVPARRYITPLLPPTGPYRVGEFSQLLTDPIRTNVNRRTNMQFMVTCWYPASPKGAAMPAPYVEPGVAWQFSKLPGSRVAALAAHSCLEVPLADDLSRYPVVLYSPSMREYRRENLMLVEELASHGFVVVGMDHRDAFAAVFPDGSVVLGETVEPWPPERTADARLVVATLEQWQNSHPLLAGRLDMDRLGAFGFAQGGSAVGDLAETDARFKASANLDGALLNDALVAAGPNKPFLMLVPEPRAYNLDDNLFLYLTRAKAPAYYFSLAGTIHNSFFDAAFLLDLETFNQAFGTPNSRATMDGPSTHALLRSILLSFFKRHLKGEEDGVMDGLATSSSSICSAIRLSGGPQITQPPISARATAGESITLSVIATGRVSYQWFLNGTLVPMATEATLTLSPVSTTSAGQYTVRISDAGGTTTCSCSVTVLP